MLMFVLENSCYINFCTEEELFSMLMSVVGLDTFDLCCCPWC